MREFNSLLEEIHLTAKQGYLERILLRSRVVRAIMPTLCSPFSFCLILAMADSRERDLRASQPLAATSQPSASPLTSTPHTSPQHSRCPPHCNRGSKHLFVQSYIKKCQIQSHSRSARKTIASPHAQRASPSTRHISITTDRRDTGMVSLERRRVENNK